MADPYELLGLTRDASEDQVKAAFRLQAKRHHPDANLDDPGAEERFKEIQAAYALLSDPLERARYDRGEEIFHPEAFDPTAIDLESILSDLLDSAGFGRGIGGRWKRGSTHDFPDLEPRRLTVRVPARVAASGGLIAVETEPGVKTKIRLPAGTADGSRLRIQSPVELVIQIKLS